MFNFFINWYYTSIDINHLFNFSNFIKLFNHQSNPRQQILKMCIYVFLGGHFGSNFKIIVTFEKLFQIIEFSTGKKYIHKIVKNTLNL